MSNILAVHATSDQCRPLVVHAVPYRSCAVIVGVAREHHGALHRIAKLFEGRLFELKLGAVEGNATNAGVGVSCDHAFFLASSEKRIRRGHTSRNRRLTE